jgi:hypothetical protein
MPFIPKLLRKNHNIPARLVLSRGFFWKLICFVRMGAFEFRPTQDRAYVEETMKSQTGDANSVLCQSVYSYLLPSLPN